jgi:hypothetical protein
MRTYARFAIVLVLDGHGRDKETGQVESKIDLTG